MTDDELAVSMSVSLSEVNEIIELRGGDLAVDMLRMARAIALLLKAERARCRNTAAMTLNHGGP